MTPSDEMRGLIERIEGDNVTFQLPPFKLSDEARREMDKVSRRVTRFYQTAHLHRFD